MFSRSQVVECLLVIGSVILACFIGLIDGELCAPVFGSVLLAVCFATRWFGVMRCAITVAVIIEILAICFIVGFQAAETKHRGDQIVECLDSYKERNGVFPQKLDALTPVCLEQIPTTAMCIFGHHQFVYSSDRDRSKYLLFFRGLFCIITYYHIETGEWIFEFR